MDVFHPSPHGSSFGSNFQISENGVNKYSSETTRRQVFVTAAVDYEQYNIIGDRIDTPGEQTGV